jgi:Skp family chaperone for outer membrane proteins
MELRFGVFSMRRSAGALLSVAVACGSCGAALAQAAAPAPTYGPPISGLCLFGQGQALGQSKAGISANQQLEQFLKSVDAELKAAAAPIVADDHALGAQKASMPAAEYQQQLGKLRQRYADLAHTRDLRRAQLALTRKDALTQVAKAMATSLAATITERHCSVIFERTGAYGAAEGMDITADVIQRMNTALPSVTLSLAPPEAVQKAAPAAK